MKQSVLFRFVQFLRSHQDFTADGNNSNSSETRPEFLDMSLDDDDSDPVVFHKALYDWSIRDKNFWGYVWQFLQIRSSHAPECIVRNEKDFLGVEFFPGARVNFAENLLHLSTDDEYRDRDALVSLAEQGIPGVEIPRQTVTYGELRNAVAKLAHTLREKGLQKMDRVVSMLPNCPEAIIAMLAVTSIGAIWSSVSPELGKTVVCDRFSQVSPVMLFASEYYPFNGKVHCIRETIEYLVDNVESLHTVVHVTFVHFTDKQNDARAKNAPLEGVLDESRHRGNQSILHYEEIISKYGDQVPELVFEQVSVTHPVYILYTSGTTGAPKCITQGFGVLINQLKEVHMHCGVTERDTVFVYTNCGWMLWHWMVTGLYLGTKLILYDGSPMWPDKLVFWKMIADERITVFGTSSRYLAAIANSGIDIVNNPDIDISQLRLINTTGSPLAAAVSVYLYKKIIKDVHLSSISGGTEINGCFALGSPFLPVYPAELQAAGLGLNVQVWNDDGERIMDDNGELVCLNTFPSAPLFFWGDKNNERYIESYFSVFDNIWCHGDLAEQNKRGGFYIKGRSDSTLNPGGVRIGTSDFYGIAESMQEVEDSIVVGQRESDGNERIILFVQLKPGIQMGDEVKNSIRAAIRKHLSPRHMPSEIVAVSAIPYNVNGKKMEKMVKRIVCGDAIKPQEVSSLKNPEVVPEYSPENWNT